jgi:hypothetical protein
MSPLHSPLSSSASTAPAANSRRTNASPLPVLSRTAFAANRSKLPSSANWENSGLNVVCSAAPAGVVVQVAFEQANFESRFSLHRPKG